MKAKYFDRVWIVLIGWIIYPIGIFVACVVLPCFWVIKHGWVNTPFFHNIKAGYVAVSEAFKESWRITNE